MQHIKRAENQASQENVPASNPQLTTGMDGHWMTRDGLKLQAQELVLNVQRHLIARVMKANHWSAEQGCSTEGQCIILDLL